MCRRKRLIALVAWIALPVLLALLLTPQPAAAQKPLRMGLIVKNLVNPFWVYMRQGAEVAAKKYGVELTTSAPTKPDNVEEQIRIMEDLIQKKVDAIIIVPADSNGIVPGIERANAANIPVALANSNAFGGKVITFTGVENYAGMVQVAEYMVKKLGGKGSVVILEGVPGAQTAMDRKQAADDVLKKYPDIKVLASQTALNQRGEGMSVMENLLQRFPSIDAVFGTNDEMALGAVEALDAAKRLDKTMVSGFDCNNDAVLAISQGRMVVTLDQQPGEQAASALEAAVQFLQGKEVPKRIVTPAALVDKSNVAAYLNRLPKK
ncbi:MAG TPA: sugar ABC transporter substrate-binding protein [Candidatus Sulfotelmatobacter sp.]|nr:sugar ABC transporter substrate-binding protein [Candidatus Sulfotelmatobacter sp.]